MFFSYSLSYLADVILNGASSAVKYGFTVFLSLLFFVSVLVFLSKILSFLFG